MDKNEAQTVVIYAHRIVSDKQKIIDAHALTSEEAVELDILLRTLFTFLNALPDVDTGLTLPPVEEPV